ncbi:MAG: heterodisulfide reductase [Thermoplasmatales archaeon SG8-52-3]|nr:MAG: heterodisulfide reductase [Thermoplasmatales archaeon SG8-52-3]
MKELDSSFKFEVAKEPGGKNIKRCFSCGTCTVTCPVFSVNDKYNPRKIIRMILLGLREEVLKSDFIWLCSGCYSCYELCPRDVKITNLMIAVRNIAVREGNIPMPMKSIVDILQKFGRLLEVSEFENIVRLKKGIPELNPTIPEVKKVLKKTDIEKVIRNSDKDD